MRDAANDFEENPKSSQVTSIVIDAKHKDAE